MEGGQAVNCSQKQTLPPKKKNPRSKTNTLAAVTGGTTTSERRHVLTKRVCKNVCGRGPKVRATGM